MLLYSSYRVGRGNVVGIATGYGLDDRGVGVPVPVGSKFFFSIASRPALGPTKPPIQRVPGALSPGVKRQGREVDYSTLANAVKSKKKVKLSL
jgi:hypothetical protein